MDFTAVAHDLRSPLHVMLGHMQLLAAEQLTATGRQRLEILEAQVQRMMRLLERWDGQPRCHLREPSTSAR
jgi:signal transduction histidine kinase